MSMITPGEQAWVDQQDTRLRDAVTLVLHGIRAAQLLTPAEARAGAEHTGIALRDYLDQLDPEALHQLAATAVLRLAEHLSKAGS